MLSQRSLGAAGKKPLPSDDEFNRVSFLSHFDGSNNGVNNVYDDSSSSNHTITANGDVTQGSFGPFARPDGEWAVSFDGNDDRLSAPDSADFDFGTGDFTVELFFNYKGSIANRWLIGGANHWQLRLKTASSPSRLGEVSFITNGSTEIIYVSTPDLADGAWHHIAITREGTNLRHFLDGALVKTTTNSEAINADSALYIGASSTNSEDWDGHISNVRVVKGTAVYTSAFTTPTAPLTAVTNTTLLTCQSNRFVDNSTSAHTITPSGDAAVSAFGPFLTDEVYDAGVNGASAYFDGTGDALSVSTSTDFNFGTDDFTVEAFILYEGPTNSDQYVIDFEGGSGSDVHFGISIYLGNWRAGAFSNDFVTAAAPTDRGWHHIALVYESNIFKFYQDGVLLGTSGSSGPFNTTTTIKIGSLHSNVASSNWDGYITDVRIVKGTAVYTSAFTPPTAPLTAVTNTKLLLNMADGQAIDSAAQNNLTLYGDAKISSTQSKFGGTSMYFDGTGDYAVVEDFTQLTGELTIEFWVNPSALSPKNGLFQQGFADGGLSIRAETNGSLTVAKTGVSSYFGTTTTISANVWTHIALVYYNGVLKCYINGTADAQTSTTSADWTTSGNEFILGTRWTGGAINNPMTGYLDDFRISSMARYVSNFTPPTEPFADKGQ